jgi:hypothetical protein
MRKYKFITLIFLILFSSTSFAKVHQGLNYQNGLIEKIQSKKWLNSNLDYLKISTDKDAPAIIPFQQILQFIPQWNGLSSKFLHLLHKDQEVYFYLIDNDGFINNSDTLIFLGSRAVGDTTFWDNYATDEPFFLTYNAASQSSKKYIINNSQLSYQQELNSINLKIHLEKDSVRSYGKDLYDSENSDNEGWYWKELIQDNLESMNTFDRYLMLHPYGSNPVNIKLLYKSVTDTLLDAVAQNKYPEYNVAVFFNNDSLKNNTFTRIKKDSFLLNFQPDQIKNELNLISLKSYEVHPYRHGTISVDYIDVNYTSKPIIEDFVNSFQIENIQENSFVNIAGFKSQKIIAIDTFNKIIQFPSSNKIQSNLYATLKVQSPFFSIKIEDSVFYSKQAGFNVIKFKISDKSSINYFFYDVYKSDFKSQIEQTSDSVVFIFAYNGTNPIQKDFVDNLSKFKFSNLSNLQKGEIWLACIKNNQILFEQKTSSNYLSAQILLDSIFQQLYSAKILIPAAQNTEIVVADSTNFSNYTLQNVSHPYLFDTTNSADVVVIYHKEFQKIAEDYKDYREQSTGLKIKTINAEDIYNEFNYGKKSPFAIKSFLQYSYNYWQDSLRTLVLIGNASWDPYKHLPNSIASDYVPIYGFPPSDFWYSILDSNYIPDISIGRISISSESDGINYINKIKLYDSIPDQPWMKNFLFLSGGKSDGERRSFANMKSYFFDEYIKFPPFCGTSDSVSKYDNNIGGNAESGLIRDKINDGAIWVNFIGHANQNIFDMDGWQAYKLNNYGKYAFFSTISCNTGAHAEPSVINSRNEDYVYFKDKGFIGSIGSSTFGWVDENRYIVQRIMSNLADSNSKLVYIGDLVNFGKNGLGNQEAQLETKNHSSLIGDPLLQLRISRFPNIYIFTPEFIITNLQGNTEINVSDTFAIIKIPFYNNGFQNSSPIKAILIDHYDNKIDTIDFEIEPVCFKLTTELRKNIQNQPGEHHLTIVLDPENTTNSIKAVNKVFETNFYVFSNSLLALEPFNQWNLDANNLEFRFINPQKESAKKYLFSIHNLNGNLVYESAEDEIQLKENYILWKPLVTLNPDNYYVYASFVDKNDHLSSELKLLFTVNNKSINENVSILQNSTASFSLNSYYNLQLDSLDNSIVLNDETKTAKLVSVSGNENTKRWGNIELGHTVFLDNEYFRGFNVVTIPKYLDYNDKPLYIQFDTWVDGDNWHKDSSSIKLVKYLKSLVGNSSVYVLIVTADKSFKVPVLLQMFEPTSIGSFDSLKAVLRNFGAKLFDSITGSYDYGDVAYKGWSHSYAMIGQYGWQPGQAIEAMSPNGDSATIIQDLKFYYRTGTFVTPFFNKVKSWKSFRIKSNFDNDYYKNHLFITIIGRNNNKIDTLLKFQIISSDTTLNLAAPLYQKYRELQIKGDLFRASDSINRKISELELNFVPLPELAIKKLMTVIDDSVNQRGEKTIMHIGFENISPRIKATNVNLNITNSNSSGSSEFYNKTFNQLNPDDSLDIEITLDNDKSQTNNNFTVLLNSQNLADEYYSFNNQTTLNNKVYEDTIKPRIDVKFDGKYIQNGNFVSQQPIIDIKVFDNSKFPINDSSKIEIMINGSFITPEKTKFYYFNSINNNTDYKCQLIIIPTKLEYGNNSISPANNIRIVAKDYAGNSDTVLFKVNVQQNNKIENVIMKQSSKSDEIILSYSFLGRNLNENTKVKLYNLMGQMVKLQEFNSKIGENNINILLFDNQGNKLPSGVYFYELDVLSTIWTEPQKGMFIITN